MRVCSSCILYPLLGSLRFAVSFFLLIRTLASMLPSMLLQHRGRSRLYFVFHQARIHSGAKQWKAHPCYHSSLFWVLLHSWCVSADLLRQDLDEFLNVEGYIVEKLFTFSSYLTFPSSLPLSSSPPPLPSHPPLALSLSLSLSLSPARSLSLPRSSFHLV